MLCVQVLVVKMGIGQLKFGTFKMKSLKNASVSFATSLTDKFNAHWVVLLRFLEVFHLVNKPPFAEQRLSFSIHHSHIGATLRAKTR